MRRLEGGAYDFLEKNQHISPNLGKDLVCFRNRRESDATEAKNRKEFKRSKWPTV